ncbi:MAG: hypothetical protein ACSHW1_13350 [Yoonia sp.]|uniref:hypothetical protein n=1 Tax=Yoonia sp. TaxID=2212373 RepID=UPI003EF11BB9
MRKWLAGVFAAVLSGLVLWWLTGPDGPFAAAPPPDPQPDIKLIDYKIDRPDITRPDGAPFSGTFTVYNDGTVMGENCNVRLNDGSSRRLGIPPKTQETFFVRTLERYSAGQEVELLAVVYCNFYRNTLVHLRYPL